MEHRLNSESKHLVLLFLAGALLLPRVVGAALGGSDQRLALEGALQPSGSSRLAALPVPSGVREQTLITPQGVSVTQWSAQGFVFALRWQGPMIPDLSAILGASFQSYNTALKARPRLGLNAPLRVQTAGLVAHTSGHMGAYSGWAYLPALVPQGLNLTTLGIEP